MRNLLDDVRTFHEVDPATGKVQHRADGKVLKPHGWTPPNIAAALAESRTP